MHKFLTMVMLSLLVGEAHFPEQALAAWPDSLPVYSHIVIVVEENKDYDEIVGNEGAPYINMLRSEGANFTQMFAEEHKSEGNYFWLFSGSNQKVGFTDETPKGMIAAPNLGSELIARGLSFRGYSEDLPEVGSMVPRKNLYARKHVPWISFSNIPQGSDPDSSTNLQYLQFPSDFSKLPTVAFVIPNLINDMHNDPDNVKNGDAWLRKNIDAYYQWAKTHNSILIVTFDENEDTNGMADPTDPSSAAKVMQNRIATIVAGARIRPGDYPEGKGINHVTILRTIEAMYGLGHAGSQQKEAAEYGIGDDKVITDIFAR